MILAICFIFYCDLFYLFKYDFISKKRVLKLEVIEFKTSSTQNANAYWVIGGDCYDCDVIFMPLLEFI